MSNKPNLLCIDDEKRILRSLNSLFRSTHNVYTTTSPAEFSRLLEEHHMHVILSDQRMPETQGTELLRFARQISPDSMRILLTGYADASAVVDSVNEGEVFRYIRKPWDIDEIRLLVKQATKIAQKLENSSSVELIEIDDYSRFEEHDTSKPFNVLYIDKDNESANSFTEKFTQKYNITHIKQFDALDKVITRKDFVVAVIDMDFGHSNISDIIYKIKKQQPLILPILLNSFSDSDTLIELINRKQIFRCCSKPVTSQALEDSLSSAVEQSELMKNDPKLQLHHLLTSITGQVIDEDDENALLALIAELDEKHKEK